LNNIIKFNTIEYKKHKDTIYSKEYLMIEFRESNKIWSESLFRINNLSCKNFPIYFICDINDNLKMVDITIEELSINDIYDTKNNFFVIINQDNIICEIANPYFWYKYILYVDLGKNIDIINKIYSHDYKLFLYYIDDNFIIKLIFSPNMRKYKLQQLSKL